MNPTLRTIGLFIILTLLFVGIGALFGYFTCYGFWTSMLFFLIFALLINAFSYFYSSKIVLWSYRARIVDEKEAPRIHKIVSEVAEAAGVPKPRVAIVPSKTPNAFATGRNPKNAVVAVTEGILKLLPDRELKGVIAHEMSHIKDRDILIMTVAATIAGAIAFAARWFWWSTLFSRRREDEGQLLIAILAMIGAAIGATLIQLAISRQREYKADEVGARTIKDPTALKNALIKLEDYNQRWPIERGNPASASLFIVNPFKGGGLIRLFSTHPPMEKRIKRLEKLEQELMFSPKTMAVEARVDGIGSPYRVK